MVKWFMEATPKIDKRTITGPINGKLGGRPKLYATKLREKLIAKAEECADELVAVLYKEAKHGNIMALKEFLDRGLGKASQGIDITTNGKELPQPILANVIVAQDAVHSNNSNAQDSADVKALESGTGRNISLQDSVHHFIPDTSSPK